MKAVKYRAAGHIEYADVECPTPGEDEVLVETHAVSICNQLDARIYTGLHTTFPLEVGEPGRHGAGVVVEVGKKVKDIKVGDKVAMIGDRMYAEFCVRRAVEVGVLKPSSSLLEAAPLGLAGCLIMTLKKVRSLRGASVIITGLGPAGLFMVQLARNAGAKKIIGLDIRTNYFDLARRFGATDTVFANDRDIVKECRESPADFGLDCSGSAPAVSMLFGMCTNVVSFGAVKQSLKVDVPGDRTVTFVNGYLREEERTEGLEAAVKLFLRKKLVSGPLITETMKLDEYALAMQKVRRGEVLKMILTC